MSKRIIYLLLALSLGLNVGVITTTLIHRSSGPPPGPMQGRGGDRGAQPGQRPDPARLVENHLRGMTQHLGLDADQQQAVREILEHRAPQLASLQAEVSKVGRQLADAFAAPEFDPEEFQRLTAEAGAARSRLDSLSAVILVDEAAVLTPEQRRAFSTVAPMMHSQPRRPPQDGGPPPDGRPPHR